MPISFDARVVEHHEHHQGDREVRADHASAGQKARYQTQEVRDEHVHKDAAEEREVALGQVPGVQHAFCEVQDAVDQQLGHVAWAQVGGGHVLQGAALGGCLGQAHTGDQGEHSDDHKDQPSGVHGVFASRFGLSNADGA